MKVFFTIINFYTQHFRFPHRGWKYMRSLLHALHLENEIYRKKIQKGIYLYINTADHIQQQLFWYGHYEKEAITLWQTIIQPDSTVIDIGANIGYYSIIAAHKAAHGQVYAFEPSSQTYAQLTHNITANKLLNIVALPLAVSDKNGQLPFYISGPDNTGMSGLSAAENFSGQIETATVTSVDEWAACKHIAKIDFIKIDIEGAEINALSGMQYVLQHHQPVLFIEIREPLLKQFGHTAFAIYHFLFNLGYIAYQVINAFTIQKNNAPLEGDTVIFAPAAYRFPAGIIIK